jgi:hypothetical protein
VSFYFVDAARLYFDSSMTNEPRILGGVL